MDDELDEEAAIAQDRERIAQALQNAQGHALDGLLVGWIIVAEWLDPADGQRWLSRLAHEGSTSWQRQGYLHNALYESWDEYE